MTHFSYRPRLPIPRVETSQVIPHNYNMEVITMMTEKQKNTILKMRAEGISFKEIAEELGMSLGSVKMFVSHHNRNNDRRYEPCGELLPKDSVRDLTTKPVDRTNAGIPGIPVDRTNANIPGILPENRACANCNKPLDPTARRTQRFCCVKCRNDWWNHHQDQISSQISDHISDQISNQVSTSKRTVKVCNVCERRFATYKAAKYCSRTCYLVSVRTE